MTDDETPSAPGRQRSAFQRRVAAVLEPLPAPLRIVLVGVVCVALVIAPFVILVLAH